MFFLIVMKPYETMWKSFSNQGCSTQSCVDIVKAIKLMLQRGLVPESWTQRYWKDEDIGNVMSFDEEVFE